MMRTTKGDGAMRTARRNVAGLVAGLLTAGGAVLPAGATQLDCLIQPREIVTVSAPVEGVLHRVAVERGDVVQEGAVLAVLESSVERSTVAIARARALQDHAIRSYQVRVDFGERRFARTDTMFKQNLVPLKELDEAETAKILATYDLVEANERKRLADLDLAHAQTVLDLRTVRSPLTGVVMDRLRHPGELASREHPIVKIARLDPLRVEVFVPVALYGRVTVGQRVVVIPEAPLDRPLEARVTVVDKVADAASSTFGVRLEIANPGNRVPGGLKCKVRLGDGTR
jgi:RND family efflux transporter MFP subunit